MIQRRRASTGSASGESRKAPAKQTTRTSPTDADRRRPRRLSWRRPAPPLPRPGRRRGTPARQPARTPAVRCVSVGEASAVCLGAARAVRAHAAGASVARGEGRRAARPRARPDPRRGAHVAGGGADVVGVGLCRGGGGLPQGPRPQPALPRGAPCLVPAPRRRRPPRARACATPSAPWSSTPSRSLPSDP